MDDIELRMQLPRWGAVVSDAGVVPWLVVDPSGQAVGPDPGVHDRVRGTEPTVECAELRVRTAQVVAMVGSPGPGLGPGNTA